MHYEYLQEGELFHVYEVEADEQKRILSLSKHEFDSFPIARRLSKRLGISIQQVYKIGSVQDRFHCKDCDGCVFWNDERKHCSMKRPCIKAKNVHKHDVIPISDLLEMVRYAQQSFLNRLRYVTIDGDVQGVVHQSYLQCLAHLANNENIIGGIRLE